MTSRPRAVSRRSVRTAGTATAVACALTLTAATGCELDSKKAARQVVQVLAESVLGETAARFFDSVGQDRDGMTSQFGGRRTGDTPALYATVPTVPACDRAKLTALLTADPAKAAEWARVEGISPQEIGAFLARTTPVLLNSDTVVKNHRYENGTAVGYPALLQAGTAVLVDPWGRPVAKCACGNPLTQLTSVPDKIKPTGMPAKWREVYRDKTVVTVTGSRDPQERFELADATDPGARVVRPVGSDGESDVWMTAPPKPTKGSGPTTPPVADPTRNPTRGPMGDPTPTQPTSRPTGTKSPYQPPTPTTPTPTTPTRPPAPDPVPNPTLTLSTSSVRVGGSYVARATGFRPGEQVRFTWTGASSGAIGVVTADANGSASTTVYEGAAPGDYRIHATGLAGNRTASAPLRVVSDRPSAPPEPALTLSTSSVRVGGSYVARATGFRPGEQVRFTWTGASSGAIGVVTADANGSASTTVYEGAAPADYRIHATGLSSNWTASAPLRVV